MDIAPLDPQTEEGKSLNERIKAEEALLGSLEGDAFDKEYMTLVTNTQQSVLNLLKASEKVKESGGQFDHFNRMEAPDDAPAQREIFALAINPKAFNHGLYQRSRSNLID